MEDRGPRVDGGGLGRVNVSVGVGLHGPLASTLFVSVRPPLETQNPRQARSRAGVDPSGQAGHIRSGLAGKVADLVRLI
jgi:hypothetical protein